VVDGYFDRAVYRETPVDNDFDALVADLILGQYNYPVRIVAVNPDLQWCEDVSIAVAREIKHRCDIADEDVDPNISHFVETYWTKSPTQSR
jgi:hypothetical protein